MSHAFANRAYQGLFKRGHLWVFAAAAAVMFAATTAQAQNSSPKDLLACDKIKKADDRLACFNTIVEKLKENPDAFKRNSSDNARGRDGKTTGNSREFGKTYVPQNTPDKIVAKVKRYWQNYYGKWHFYLENGQIWKETSGSHMKLTRKVEQVKIKKGAFGGYLIVIKGAATTGRVKRID